MQALKILAAIAVFVVISGCESLDQKGAEKEPEIILVTPNLDDDDGDGTPDATDEIINGPLDREDLTTLEIPAIVSGSGYRFSGQGADLYRVLEIEHSDSGKAKVWIEAKGPRSSQSVGKLTFYVPHTRNASVEYHLDVKPFALNCSIDSAEEIFVSGVQETTPFRGQLSAHLEEISDAPKLTVVDRGEYEKLGVWIQDSTEIGSFVGTSIHAAIAGLRGKHSRSAQFLDKRFAEIFPGTDQCVLQIGESLPDRGYIDWFGNLELTPPFVTSDGRFYPLGRVLVGRQGRLTMHTDVMTFLRDQGVQWPPIVLDTGFLWIGHVDEIVNFVPSITGFKLLVASPALGREMLEEFVQMGHDEAVILKGLNSKNGESAAITVNEVLNDPNITAMNDRAAKIMASNRLKIKREMTLRDDDIIDLPVMFWKEKGIALWPNPVNGLVIDDHYFISKPHGPTNNGIDLIEEAYRKALSRAGIDLHFIDAWDAFSKNGGDIHCGTNAVRHRTN